MTPTAEQCADTIHAALSVAPTLVDDLLWVTADVDLPPAPNPDRPTRYRPAGDDPDHVPGERLALGIGNDRARAVLAQTRQQIADSHRLAVRAVTELHAHHNRPPRRQPPGPPPTPDAMVAGTVRRLRWLLTDGVTNVDHIRATAWAAAVQLLAAHATLQTVLRDAAGSNQPPAAWRCYNCQEWCGPERKRVGRAQVECANCETYRLRWARKGQPGKLRPPRHADAHAAKKRRVVRGEDHAASPLPHPQQAS